jgi:hypothetical protein
MTYLIPVPNNNPTNAEIAASSIIDSINNEINHRVAVHQICFDTLWNNSRPDATASNILTALGTNAGLVFAFAVENLNHIGRCAAIIGKTREDYIPDSQCVPPPFTINSDGTATLN